MWQNMMMKGMNGDWMMVLHLHVRSGRGRNGGITDNEPVDVCFKAHCLPSRLGDHGDASVMFLERIPGGIDAFLAKCRR